MQTEQMGEHTCHVHEGQGKDRGFTRGLRVRGEDGNAGQELVENLQASRYTSVRRQRLANVVLVQRQENGNVRLKRGMKHNHPQGSRRRKEGLCCRFWSVCETIIKVNMKRPSKTNFTSIMTDFKVKQNN